MPDEQQIANVQHALKRSDQGFVEGVVREFGPMGLLVGGSVLAGAVILVNFVSDTFTLASLQVTADPSETVE